MPTDLPTKTPEPNETERPPQPPPNRGQESGGIHLLTVAGIPIRLHWTFLLLLIVMLAWDGLSGTTARHGLGARGGVFFLLAIFACVTLHELGHALVAKMHGIRTRDILLLPIGGVASLEAMPKPRQELWIALAGPAVNVVIAAGIYLFLTLSGQNGAIRFNTQGGFLSSLMVVNLWLVAFNMIPAFPMDGGRVLRAILSFSMGENRATQVAAAIGQGAALLLGLIGVLLPSWSLVFIAVMVYFGAGQEAQAYRTRTLVTGHRVREAMMRDFRFLTVGQTLREAAQVLLDGSQQDFPVLHGEEVVGVLSRSALLQGIAQEGQEAYVAGAMEREFPTVRPEDDLETVLMSMRQSGPILVMADESNRAASLVGILTQENLLEFLTLTQITTRS